MSGPGYLPLNLATAVRTAFTPEERAAMSGDASWKVARLVEDAFAQGYGDD